MSHNAVAGKTLRFTFKNGPMAGKTFEHVFERSGSVRFHPMDATGEDTTVRDYESAAIGPDVAVISYLSSSGFTLTAVLDYRTKALVAFSSNDKMHLMQYGTFEEVGPRLDAHQAAVARVASHR
jgi:hypothetical protein